MRGQAILQVDAGERRRKLPQVRRRRANQARELAKAPMRRREGRLRARQAQGEPFRVIAARLDMNGGALDGSHAAALRPAAHGGVKLGQREVLFVVRPREPLRPSSCTSWRARVTAAAWAFSMAFRCSGVPAAQRIDTDLPGVRVRSVPAQCPAPAPRTSGWPVLESRPAHRSRKDSISIFAPWATTVPPGDHQTPSPWLA